MSVGDDSEAGDGLLVEGSKAGRPREPFRAPRLGLVLFIGGSVVALVGFAGIMLTKHPHALGLSRDTGGLLFVASLACFAAGTLAACIGRGLNGPDAGRFVGLARLRAALNPSDQAPPARAHFSVFLRSFDDDGGTWNPPMNPFGGRETAEEELREVLWPLGQLIAIGRPGEKLQTPGAARVYLDGDEWQGAVKDLVDAAALVIVRVGKTAGLWWEIEEVARRVPPERVLLLLAFSGSRKKRRAAYEEFRSRAVRLFPRGLPGEVGDAPFIWFGPDWQPQPLGRYPRLFLRLLSRSNGNARGPRYHEALLPVFDALGVPQRPARPSASEWLGVGLFSCLPLFVVGVVTLFVYFAVQYSLGALVSCGFAGLSAFLLGVVGWVAYSILRRPD